MALSQKHVGKYVVPWFCGAEWILVFDKIYGDNFNPKTRAEALDILNVWKSRTPLLPRGVEGTYIILEALLVNRANYDDYNIQLLLSTSVMRFLNICAAYDKNQGTFYQSACKVKLPEWLINLRHEIAHGQNLPSLFTLDNAMQFSLEWLSTEYWKPAALEMKDFIDDTKFQSDKYENLKSAIQPLVSNYCYTILAKHSYWNINYVKDIADEDTKLSFLEELEMLTNTLEINENIAFNTVQKLLWENIEKLLNNSQDVANKEHIIPEILIKENIFLGDFDERKEIFPNLNEIPLDFLMLWEKLLVIMQRLNMLEPLMQKLLQLLTKNEIKHETKQIASLWLLEIGKGLLRCVFAYDLMKELSVMGELTKLQIKHKIQEILKRKYKERNVLNFNYNFDIPEIITNVSKFKTFVLENPNQYVQIFISEYLDLNEVLKRTEYKKKVMELVNIYMSQNLDEEIDPMIHDVEELMEIDQKVVKKNEMKVEQNVNKKIDEIYVEKRWRKITEFNFEKCPIGILPWQEPNMNPLLN